MQDLEELSFMHRGYLLSAQNLGRPIPEDDPIVAEEKVTLCVQDGSYTQAAHLHIYSCFQARISPVRGKTIFSREK